MSLFPDRAPSEEGEVGLKAAPTARGDVGSTQDFTPPGPSPSRRSGWKIWRLRTHPSDMPGCHPLPRRARGSIRHLRHCFGTKSLREPAPPNSLSPPYLARVHAAMASHCYRNPFCPTTPTARLKLNCTKTQGGSHLTPKSTKCAQMPTQKTDARLSPCNETPALGRGLMEGARSGIPATSCHGKRLGCLHHQHPAPTICSASILESNGARRYTAPNLPTYRARQQISAKR